MVPLLLGWRENLSPCGCSLARFERLLTSDHLEYDCKCAHIISVPLKEGSRLHEGQMKEPGIGHMVAPNGAKRWVDAHAVRAGFSSVASHLE